MNSAEIAARDVQIPRRASAGSDADGVESRPQLTGSELHANVDAGEELHSFRLQLRETEIEHRLLQLELGDSVAEQSANALVLLEDHYGVPRAAQLLRRSKAGGA